LLSSAYWPIPSMSRRVINSAKLCLSQSFSRIKWIDQWAVDQDPVLTSTTSAQTGKTTISAPSGHSATADGAWMEKVQTLGGGLRWIERLIESYPFLDWLNINLSLYSSLFFAQRRLEQPPPRRPSSPATIQRLHLYHERSAPGYRSRHRCPPHTNRRYHRHSSPLQRRRGLRRWRGRRRRRIWNRLRCGWGSFYPSPNAPNVRTLNGHNEIPLAKHPSWGHVAQWDFDMAVQRSDVRGVRAGVEWPLLSPLRDRHRPRSHWGRSGGGRAWKSSSRISAGRRRPRGGALPPVAPGSSRRTMPAPKGSAKGRWSAASATFQGAASRAPR